MENQENSNDSAEVADLEISTLSGDIRDFLLTHLRDMKVGWSFLPEREQTEKIHIAARAAENLVCQVVRLVEKHEHAAVHVEIGCIKIDKNLEIKTTAFTSVANITALAEYGQKHAVLLLSDPEKFFGERAAAHVDPDQPPLVDE